MKNIAIFLFVLIYLNTTTFAENRKYMDFNGATKKLLENIYGENDIYMKTVYCQATFNNKKEIINTNGFSHHDSNGNKTTTKLDKKIEWEHIVPAALFGSTFTEWKIGDAKCVSVSKMSILNNRACAIKTNPEFKKIYSDLHNIYPVIGRINRARKNYKFIAGDAEISILSRAKFMIGREEVNLQFGLCPIQISETKKVIPPNHAKGIIARTYLYMNSKYKAKRVKLYSEQKRLYQKWSEEYPVTIEECSRAKYIEKLQKNKNKIVEKLCNENKMW